MSRAELDLVPIVDEDGALAGVVTERALARRYIRETRQTSTLQEAPTHVQAVVDVLEGELVAGEDKQLSGRVWVHSMDVGAPSGISEGDVVVVGNRADAQRLAIELGAALLVVSNGATPGSGGAGARRERGTAVIVSPLDTYVSGRMITLAAPCHAFMEKDPLTVTTEYLVADVSEQIKEIHYGAAVVVDAHRRPVGLITRSDLVAPARRRVMLVDHAEEGQSVAGVEQAEIVEILDHHHIGSIETRVPVTATFDPVGSTATLVIERFRQNGMEPSRPTASMLLGAVLSDTVILNSATTTERDHSVVEYLERVLALDAAELGPRDVRGHSRRLGGQRRGDRHPRRQAVPGPRRPDDLHRPDRGRRQEVCSSARPSCSRRCDAERERQGLPSLRADDHRRPVEGHRPARLRGHRRRRALLRVGLDDGMIELPGVMSRKKEVAPKLLAAL